MPIMPDFIDLFRNTSSTSSKFTNYIIIGINGKFHHYVKSSKQRRVDKNEKRQLIFEQDKQKLVDKIKEDKIEELRDKIKSFEILMVERDDYAGKLDKLFKLGLIDSDGNPLNLTDQTFNQKEEEVKSENSDM